MKLLQIGNESIAFQNGAFFKALTLIIQDMRASGLEKADDLGKFAVRIDQCVYEHTGITTSVRFVDNWDNSVILLPTMAKGHVLNSPSFLKLVSKYYNIDNNAFLDIEKEGWIDPATSRVGGAFSEIIFKTYLGSLDMLKGKLTPEESAAEILHEVGHAYTFLQFMADTVLVNSVLQRTWQELTNSAADKKVRIIITKAADAVQIANREWLQAISDDTDPVVAFKVLASAAYIEPRSMDNKVYFSQNASEELAEIFAVRHGAGRALLTMRSKIKYDNSYSYGYLKDIAWTIASSFLTLLIPEVGVPLAAMGIVTIISKLIVHSIDASSTPDITTFKQTATKIRNQFVEQLKTSKLPKQDIADIVESIELADKLIQGYNGDFDRDWVVRFFDMLKRGKMDARSSRAYTDKLEVLAANDLFIRAAQLSTR